MRLDAATESASSNSEIAKLDYRLSLETFTISAGAHSAETDVSISDFKMLMTWWVRAARLFTQRGTDHMIVGKQDSERMGRSEELVSSWELAR